MSERTEIDAAGITASQGTVANSGGSNSEESHMSEQVARLGRPRLGWTAIGNELVQLAAA